MNMQEQIEKILEALPEDASVTYTINFNVTPEGVEVVPPPTVVPPPIPIGQEYLVVVDRNIKPNGKAKVRIYPGGPENSFVLDGDKVYGALPAQELRDCIFIAEGRSVSGWHMAGWVDKEYLQEV